MSSAMCVDWSDVEAAAKELAGNWKDFESFGWNRVFELEDADKWGIIYTSNRDSDLLAQSNQEAISEMLSKYADGDDPDLVFERHSHWAVGHVDGFSVRVYRPDGTITDAFKEICQIQEKLANYPVLDEEDYSKREYEATLESYRNEIGHYRSDLPEGWESQVYTHFSDNGDYKYVESRDDQGGWAPQEALVEALTDMGLLEPDDDEEE